MGYSSLHQSAKVVDERVRPGVNTSPGGPGPDHPQLVRLQERLLQLVRQVRDELTAPTTRQLLQRGTQGRGVTAEEAVGDVAAGIEKAIRALKVWEMEIRAGLEEKSRSPSLRGAPDLPARIARFLAERAERPGFSYEFDHDLLRGWVLRWKEYTPDGRIRGYGQLFERPYAWLDD